MTKDPQAPELPLVDNGKASDQGASDLGAAGQAAPRKRTKLWLVPLLMLTLFTGAVIGMYFQPPGLRAFFGVTGLQPGAGTDTPIAVAIQKVKAQEEVAIVSEGDVVALGRVIPKGDVISVATPSGAGDARLAEIRVAVGDQVARGDVLAVLDNLGQLETGIATAKAVIAVRKAALAHINHRSSMPCRG